MTGLGPRLLGRSGLFRLSLEVLAHKLNLVCLKRAGVALLVVDTNCRQVVKNRFALDFQFSGQIVDAGFIHSVLRYLLCFPQLFLLCKHLDCFHLRYEQENPASNQIPFSQLLFFRSLLRLYQLRMFSLRLLPMSAKLGSICGWCILDTRGGIS